MTMEPGRKAPRRGSLSVFLKITADVRVAITHRVPRDVAIIGASSKTADMLAHEEFCRGISCRTHPQQKPRAFLQSEHREVVHRHDDC
jgi:hypothetical protein